MAFINFAGVPLSGIAYVVSAIVLLPINSALNPILYSDAFDKFIETVRNRISSKSGKEKKSDRSNQNNRASDVKTSTDNSKSS